MMPNVLLPILLSCIAPLASATPLHKDPQTLEIRQEGLDWPKCSKTGKESCTIYMATGDTMFAKYRNAVLFDHDCNIKQAFRTEKDNPKIVLKGHLPKYVDIFVDDQARPQGRISYDSKDTPLNEESMACHKFPGTDGIIVNNRTNMSVPQDPTMKMQSCIIKSWAEDVSIFEVLDPDALLPWAAPPSPSQQRPKACCTSELADVGDGILYSNLSDEGEELGDVGQKLWWDLRDAMAGSETVPKPLWDADQDLRKRLGRVLPFVLNANDNREMGGLQQELERIYSLNRLSKRCVDESEPEAEWNTVVDAPLLEMVFGLGQGPEKVGFRCMGSDKIDSRWLPSHSSGLVSAAKQIDFVIHLGDAEIQSRIASRRWMFTPSINHTNRDGLRKKPIAISIETKTINRSEAEARVQLAIWVASQIERIRLLLSREVLDELISGMVFPLLFVQAENWSIFFARLDPDNLSHIHIYTGKRIGDTSSVLGVYSLLQCMRRLREFVEGTYAEWWHRVLDEVDQVYESGTGPQFVQMQE
ncbi:hypothetical protein F66182_4168 [Fusarium sp. NRRL 66182]|nr:hypothetical protein F66182_4168 [Fusarium sp. NRRL 66182]